MLVRQVLPFSSRTFLKRISLVHEFSTTSCSQGLVTQEISNRVLTVTMNRPELSNAFNEDLIEEMIKVFTNVDTNLVKVVVLTGSGKQFSAGADLNWMKKMVNYTKEENEEDAGKLFEMFRVIRSLPLPTIARVNGAALGGGAGLVAACDIAIGLESCIFGFTEVKLGLIPAVISPFVISKIGKAKASRYCLTGERFSSRVAVAIGLLDSCFSSPSELDEELRKIISEILGASPAAVRKCKNLIETVAEMSIHEPRTKEFVCGQISSIRVSQEGQEGLNSFLNKRKPSWVAE
eukprot:TRINITY_DN4762_c0_g2_i2.p1 TRINITY_DN4762_c0_g2~~TRINITY_DN4762_c0_g2_i2.p1  ORF type:complete len:292 (-),score=66.87 TRINITY_DN4762_c0_g2_i2:108-983(-)